MSRYDYYYGGGDDDEDIDNKIERVLRNLRNSAGDDGEPYEGQAGDYTGGKKRKKASGKKASGKKASGKKSGRKSIGGKKSTVGRKTKKRTGKKTKSTRKTKRRTRRKVGGSDDGIEYL
jgi:hypothetical protein